MKAPGPAQADCMSRMLVEDLEDCCARQTIRLGYL